MDLQQLATDLRSKVTAAGQLLLDNSTINQDSFAFVLSYFKDKKIVLTGITQPDQQISVEGKVLTINGEEELFGQSLSTKIQLVEKSDTELSSDYETRLEQVTFDNLIGWGIIPTDVYNPASILPTNPFDTVGMRISSEEIVQTWSAKDSKNTMSLVPAIGLELSKMGFSISRSPDPLSQQISTSFSVIGTFELGQTNLTVGVTVPISTASPAGQWNLTLSSTSTLADGIADLSQLVFGNNVFAALPPGFQDALEFTLEELLINFYLDDQGVKYTKILISRAKPWEVVSNFTILSASAAFMLSKAGSKYQLAADLAGKFKIGSDDSTTVLLEVAMNIPAGNSDWLINMSGALENNSIDDLFLSLPVGEGQTLPEFPVGLDLESITLNFLTISFNPSSKKLSYISFSVESQLEFGIFNILTVQNPYAALDVQSPSTTNEITGNVGGNLVVANLPLALNASKPSADAGWTFTAGMLPGTKIPILDLVQVFLKTLNITTLPDWVDQAQLNIQDVFFSAYVPTATSKNQTQKYHVEGSVMWQIDVNSFALPELLATVSADFENGKASGTIAVEATVLLLPFKLGYKFGTPDTEVYLEWLGIQADYKHNSTTNIDTITITFADMSVGEIITHLIESFEPGFQLPPPWDKLNAINLSGLSLIYTNSKNDTTKNKIVIAYTQKIDLKFLEIDEVTLTKDNSGVFIGFKGKFLGIPITSENPDTEKLAGKGSDVRDLGGVPVPGMGDKYFDLEYLGLGQHVTLYPFEDLKTVEQAVDRLENVFKEPATPAPGQPPILPIPAKPASPPVEPILVFDENSNWLIGTKFTIIEAITLGVVFNDPNLYGLLVGLNGEKVKAFNGLKFQILYKKVNDSVGVYQIELKLPDAIRQLQFGAVSVTLPIIGIDIYTNGSFKLDFGFPYNMDFSRSLTVQAFPFTGSGGFYFAYLHGVPSDKVPTTSLGIFNPIIEFGLGLQLGVGKSINAGILKAGFSVTAVGILEGVFAWYEPNQSTGNSKDLFYRIEATVGLVGRLYGEINFAIISATLDITVYAYVQMVVEAFRAIPIYLEAGVSVSLRVTINLGIFKIHVNLHFSAKVSASFTIGSDSQAPWDENPPLKANSFAFFQAAEQDPLQVKWQPLTMTEAEKQPINLYFFPQLTVASTGATNTAQFANLLYIDAPVNQEDVTSSLNNLVKGVLYWSINAVVNSDKSGTSLAELKLETLSVGILKQLHAYLSDTQTTRTPIPYLTETHDDIETFLQNFFKIDILDIEQAMTATADANNELNASIFPILPLLKLAWELKGEKHDLSTYNIDNAYIDDIQAAFKQLQVDYQNKVEKGQDEAAQSAHQLSDVNLAVFADLEQNMPTFIFQDYILMIAKSAIQDVIDEMEAYRYGFKETDTLKGLSDAFNQLSFTNPESGEITTNNLSPGALATANKTLNIKQGITLEIPDISYQVQTGDSFQTILDLFNKGLTAANQITAAQLATIKNTNIQGLVAAGTTVSITNFPAYDVLVGQTLQQVAGAIKNAAAESPTVVQVVEALVNDKVLLSLAVLEIPTLKYETGASDNFESLSNNYGISIDTLASNIQNALIPGLFEGQTIAIPNLLVLGVESAVDTFDTNDNIARISAMTSRFFLHGMRLPNPENRAQYDALYQLTGQQFSIPAVAQDDPFSITLSKPENTDWIAFNGAEANQSIAVGIDNPTISRINNLITIALNPDTSPLPPQSIPMGQVSAETFSLKSGINWQYPGKLVLPIGAPIEQAVPQPTIWNFSEALMGRLELNNTDLGLQVMKLIRQKDSGGFVKEQAQNYAFSTLLQVTVQKLEGDADGAPLLKNTYELIGADDTSIVLLERLLQYMNSAGGSDAIIQQIQILYPPASAKTEGTPSGLQSAVNGGLQSAIIQTNLSTETNPTQAFFVQGAQVEEPRNTLNTFHDFISLLWQCSIVRSGGYYLLYQTTDGGDALPDQLFSQGKNASIYLLITYTGELSKDFVNSAVIADNINTSTTTVFVEAEGLTTMAAIAPPGNAGFELERVKPDEYIPVVPYPIPPTPESKQQDINYLNYQYNLLGYQLLASPDFNGIDSLLPVGPTNDMSQDELNNAQALPDAALAEENWKYTSLLPLARHAINRIQPKKATYPAAQEDPYAGIGAIAKVRLNWQDMLGNSLQTPISDGSQDLSLQFLYTDQILSISKWTSVSAYYSFPLIGGQPNLCIDLVIDPGRYQVTLEQPKEEVIQNALVDQVIYKSAYYQLIQPDIKVTLETSLNIEASTHEYVLPAATFSDFVGDMYAYLEDVINDPDTATAPSNISIKEPIELVNSKIIFELTVDLKIERTKNIDPTFANAQGVSVATSALKPVTTTNQQNGMIAQSVQADETVSLTAFAEQFEATFIDRPSTGNFLKIAVGIDRNDISNGPNDKKVWVVHFDQNGVNGMYYEFDNSQQYFYSPMPLANNLESYEQVPINNYKSGESYPYGTAQNKTFNGIDLDSWGRQCLDSIDQFLSPEFSVPAFLLDEGQSLQAILDAKEKIAEGIAGTVNNILEIDSPDQSSLENAKEKLKQRVLIQLSNAYKIDAVVQNAVQIKHGFSGSNEPTNQAPFVPQLYGQMVGDLGTATISPHAMLGANEVPSDEYSLSTAKIPLGTGTSWLTYLFDAKEAEKHSNFNFTDMFFRISYIEHQIDTVPDMGEYRASSWLTFIIPIEESMTQVGPVDIPIPLRAYPTPPSVNNQQTLYKLTGNPSAITTIPDAKKWGYQFGYQPPVASQDQIQAQLQFNVDETVNQQSKAFFQMEDGSFDPTFLPATLAQFISSYPAISQDFTSALTKILPTTPQDDPLFNQALMAVKAFGTIIENIGEAWQQWNQVKTMHAAFLAGLQAKLPLITYNYQLLETPEIPTDPSSNLLYTIDQTGGFPLPSVSLPGYTTETNGNASTFYNQVDGVKTYLKYNERQTVPSRILTLDPLNIMAEQNAWSGVELTRNGLLIEGKTTNPKFIYKTPMVKFYNKLVPLLVCNETVKVAEINSPGNPQTLTLDQHLQNLINQLIENQDNLDQTVKLECLYQYNLEGLQTFNTITLPILLASPTQIPINANQVEHSNPKASGLTEESGFATNLNKVIINWFKMNDPFQNRGMLQFKIEIYSIDNNQLPVLKLNNVVLPIVYVSDLKK